MSKHIDGQKLEQRNQILKEAGTHLNKERDGLQLRHDKQLARLRFFEQALESSRGRLTRVLDDWDHPLADSIWQGCRTLQETSKGLSIQGCPVLFRLHRNTVIDVANQTKLLHENYLPPFDLEYLLEGHRIASDSILTCSLESVGEHSRISGPNSLLIIQYFINQSFGSGMASW